METKAFGWYRFNEERNFMHIVHKANPLHCIPSQVENKTLHAISESGRTL